MMRTYGTMVAYLFQPLTWPSILVILNLSLSSTAVHFWSMYFSSTPLEFVRLHGLFCRSSTSKTGKSRVFSIRVAHDKGNLQHTMSRRYLIHIRRIPKKCELEKVYQNDRMTRNTPFPTQWALPTKSLRVYVYMYTCCMPTSFLELNFDGQP